MIPLIYSLDDELAMREIYAQALGYGGYRHKEFESWADLNAAIKEEVPDLLLLDLMLGPIDGLRILKNLKDDALTANIPVIIISAKGEEKDKVKGFDLGADDYIAKPFGVLELLARVKARLRHTPKKEDETGLLLDDDKRTFFVSGRALDLTLKEFEVLRLLYLNRGKVVNKEGLLSSIWDMPEGIETRTLDVHISSIRKKLEGSNITIKTVRGIGFIMV